MAAELGVAPRYIQRLRVSSGSGIRACFAPSKQARPAATIPREGAAGAGCLLAGEGRRASHDDRPAQGWSRYKLPAGISDHKGE